MSKLPEDDVRVLRDAISSVSKDITMDHDGAVFISTEILLADGTTLELGLRENEEDTGLELICHHHCKKTADEFFVYREDCRRRWLATQCMQPLNTPLHALA